MAPLRKKRAVSLTLTEIGTLIIAIVVTAKDDALFLKKEIIKV
jgi:hypothetical protein